MDFDFYIISQIICQEYKIYDFLKHAIKYDKFHVISLDVIDFITISM